MVSEEIQAGEDEEDSMFRKRKDRYRKTHVDQVKKLKLEVLSLEEENKSLKSYIKAKN